MNRPPAEPGPREPDADLPAPDAGPRFLVDHMLEKLGRYLRCLGFDAEWDRGATTMELVRRANAEGRILLTRNHRLLHQHPTSEARHMITADDPVAQLRELAAREPLSELARPFTRCIRCNVGLDDVSSDDPRLAALPPRVRERYSRYFSCPRCRTLFWRGTHVSNTLTKLGWPAVAEVPPDSG